MVSDEGNEQDANKKMKWHHRTLKSRSSTWPVPLLRPPFWNHVVHAPVFANISYSRQV